MNNGNPDGSAKRNAHGYEVASVGKALELLTAFSSEVPTWTLAGLSRHLGFPKSTAHSLLKTLQSFDLIRQNQQERTYHLGPRALELGLVFSQGAAPLAQARPVLRRLAAKSGETAKLGVLAGNQVLVIAAVESAHQLHTRGDVGTRWPLHSTSLGKAILSALPAIEAQALLERQDLNRYTHRTATSWPKLRVDLAAIRHRGYALDLEENEHGVRCVAAAFTDPLRGDVSAISVSGPSLRLAVGDLKNLAIEVIAAARSLGPPAKWEEL